MHGAFALAAAYAEQASTFVLSKPYTPVWEMKDLAVGQRVIPTSQTSGIFRLTSLPAVLLLYLGKAFSFPVSWLLWASVTAKGVWGGVYVRGGSLIRGPWVMGDKSVLRIKPGSKRLCSAVTVWRKIGEREAWGERTRWGLVKGNE